MTMKQKRKYKKKETVNYYSDDIYIFSVITYNLLSTQTKEKTTVRKQRIKNQ